MDPTLEENQGNQQQKRQHGSTAIDNFNNLVRARRLLKNPLGKFATRVAAQTAIRGLGAFLFSPAGLVIIVIAGICIFVLIIVSSGVFGGAPSAPASEPSSQTVNPVPVEAITPAIAPTEIPTPAPAP